MNSGFLAPMLLPNQLIAPAGTRLPFNNTNPPPTWTTDANAAFSDCSMRVVNTTGGGTGGATAWSSWNFGGTFNCAAVTLGVGNLPAHNHGISDPGHQHVLNDPTHQHASTSGTGIICQGGVNVINFGGANLAIQTAAAVTTFSATGITMNTAFTGITTTNTGSGTSFTPTLTTPQVKFTDFVIGIKA